MQIKDQEKSFATNKSNTYELYENRRVYRDEILMTEDQHGHDDIHIKDAVADFWYDRLLYGKVNRTGDIIIPREDFLAPLQNKKNKTYYAIDFVAAAFNDFRSYFEKHTKSNLIPNKKTLFASIEPAEAWQSIYDIYHEYMSSVYQTFFDYLTNIRGHEKIKNFDDFANEFFIFARDIVINSTNAPITLSRFVTDFTTDSKCGGLTIDLFKARASNDILKSELFIKDINFKFYVDAANRHGFVIDKNIPWRIHANLTSEQMKALMESDEFDVDYNLTEDHLFNIYYIKTYTMDLILLRKYFYDMYDSLVSSIPILIKPKYCTNLQVARPDYFRRKFLTLSEREKKYNVKDYWIDKAFRFRLLELKNDLLEADIKNHINKAKSVYDIRGEMQSLKYLHNVTKVFFLHQYNKTRKNIQVGAPTHKKTI